MPPTIRVAAAGDLHVKASNQEAVREAFVAHDADVDLFLLAGDLSTHGEPEQAARLVECCSGLEAPVYAVLGNHDWHAAKGTEFAAVLEEGGVHVLDRSWTVATVHGEEVGIVGTKGFVGGFTGSHLPDFGEPLLRQVYAECTREIEALDHGLREIALCPYRIVLLHYAPTCETLVGERKEIWTFLGTDRLASPILEHQPDFVLHGHAHAGQFEGRIGEVPVYNVSVPVMRRDFWVFELSGAGRSRTPIH